MDKFTHIDALIKSQALSTDELIKHWIENKSLDIEKIIQAYTCIPVDKAHIEEITFGMIWYTDDTVSRELRPDKKVKSVILGIDTEYNVIYSDTFIEKLNISKTEMELFLDDHPEFDLASQHKLSWLTQKSKELNMILKKIGKPTWNGRTYWCAENTLQDGSTIAHFLPDHMKIIIDAEEPQDFHPIYEYLVRQ